MPNARVRTEVMIQIGTVAFCMVAAYFGFLKRRSEKIMRASLSHLREGFFWLGIIAILECVNGYYSGYGLFQILVDLYKVMEILIFYVFLSFIWRSAKDMEHAIAWIIIEMFVFSFIEIYTTKRGGVGLNILMSFFPIFFAWGFYERRKHYWPIVILAVITVFLCQTRTYMLGFLLAVAMVLLLAKGRYRKEILHVGTFFVVFGGVCIAVYMGATDSELIRSILSRIMELTSGFESAGGYRLYEIQTAMRKFLEAPVLGKGFGYTEYLYIQEMGYFVWGDFMHNVYIEILTKTGFVGLLIYGYVLIKHLLSQRKSIIICGYAEKAKAAGILMGGLAATMSWVAVYAAAPLSTYGYIFLPGIVAMLYYQLTMTELDLAEKEYVD